jgi:hypothetical protein
MIVIRKNISHEKGEHRLFDEIRYFFYITNDWESEKACILGMEFKTFLNAFIKIPCQIVRAGRQLIYRVLNYNPHLPVFFRMARVLRC